MKNIKEKLIYLALLIPTVTEFIESGRLPSTAHDIITDVSLTAILLVLILVSRKQSKEIQKLEETIKETSSHDPLTQLPLRENFEKDLQQAVSKNLHEEQNMHLVCIDVENFKELNETYGYSAGDDVLIKIVKQIKTIIPENSGQLYRLGGDTFALLYPEVDSKLEEQIVTNLVTLSASGQKILNKYQSSLSSGIAKYKHGDNAEKFWMRAVENMRSKRSAKKAA